MYQYTPVQGDCHHVRVIQFRKRHLSCIVEIPFSTVHPYFCDVNGTIDQCDSLWHFLNINGHSNYLTLLDNCGYGASITKICAARSRSGE